MIAQALAPTRSWSTAVALPGGGWRAMPRPVRAAAVAMSKSLLNPGLADRTAALLLLAFAVLWAVSATIRNLGLTLQYDMVQSFAYSREFAFGYERHPPLINWIVAAYFAVMPARPWAYYLLASLNAALGMYAVWLAAGYVVDLRRRVIAVALLGLLPQFTFLASTFNHNTIQLSLWPLVALSFFASITQRRLVWSVLFGMMSGLAILGKYYAGLIVVACMLAALVHPDRRAYFESWRPWVAAISCIMVMAPTLEWLVETGFYSVKRPISDYGGKDVRSLVVLSLRYGAAFVLYLLPMLVAVAVLLRPSFGTVRRIFRQALPSTHAVVGCIALAPVLLTLVMLPLAGIAAHVPWMYPAFFFAPLALIAAPNLFVSRRAVALAVLGATALAALGVAISPILMVAAFRFEREPRVVPNHALADMATEIWHCRTGRPLAVVGGSLSTTQSISFYSKDHPSVLPTASATMPANVISKRWAEADILGVCRKAEATCHRTMAYHLPDAERVDVRAPVTFLGMRRDTEEFVLYLRPNGEAQGAAEQGAVTRAGRPARVPRCVRPNDPAIDAIMTPSIRVPRDASRSDCEPSCRQRCHSA